MAMRKKMKKNTVRMVQGNKNTARKPMVKSSPKKSFVPGARK